MSGAHRMSPQIRVVNADKVAASLDGLFERGHHAEDLERGASDRIAREPNRHVDA